MRLFTPGKSHKIKKSLAGSDWKRSPYLRCFLCKKTFLPGASKKKGPNQGRLGKLFTQVAIQFSSPLKKQLTHPDVEDVIARDEISAVTHANKSVGLQMTVRSITVRFLGSSRDESLDHACGRHFRSHGARACLHSDEGLQMSDVHVRKLGRMHDGEPIFTDVEGDTELQAGRPE